MKSAPRFTASLGLSIVAVFLAVVFISAAGLFWLLNREFRQRLPLITQLTYRETAARLVPELQPLVEHRIDEEALLRKIYQLSTEIPSSRVMLLDQFGKSPERLVHGRVWLWQVQLLELEPVRNFLSQSTKLTEPLYFRVYDDETPTIFSAAPIVLEDQPGYLLLMLQQDPFWATIGMQFDFDIFTYTAFIILLVELAAVPLGLFVFLSITRPFRAMTRAIEEFGNGNYSIRLSVPNRNEIFLYARAFNRMAETIGSQAEAMKQDDSLRREFIRNAAGSLSAPLKQIADEEANVSSTQSASQRIAGYQALRIRCDHLRKIIEDLFTRAYLDIAGN